MEERTSLSQFFAWTLMTFAIVILAITPIGMVTGDNAKAASALFSLGSSGLTYQVLVQVFGISFYVNVIRTVFMSEYLLKNMMLMWRIVCMFIGIFAGVGLLAILFGWFPGNDLIAWISYLIAFSVCTAVSILATAIRLRIVNARVERKLEEYKQGAKGVQTRNESNP